MQNQKRSFSNKGKWAPTTTAQVECKFRFERIGPSTISLLITNSASLKLREELTRLGCIRTGTHQYNVNETRLKEVEKLCKEEPGTRKEEISFLNDLAKHYTAPFGERLSFSIIDEGKKSRSTFADDKIPTYTINYAQEQEQHFNLSTLKLKCKQLANLYKFQEDGVNFAISRNGRCLIGDEMGVGKTIQALALAAVYQTDWPCVILCPASLKFNWAAETKKWLGDLVANAEIQVVQTTKDFVFSSVKFIIVSFEMAKKQSMIEKIVKVKPNMSIVDEAHYLKSHGSQRSKVLLPFLMRRKRVLLLSGTPALSRPKEIYNLLRIIRPDKYQNFKPFGNRYCAPSLSRFSNAIEYVGSENRSELHYVLSTIMIRRLKKEVLSELPPKNRQKRIIETDMSVIRQMEVIKSKAERESGGGTSLDSIISNIMMEQTSTPVSGGGGTGQQLLFTQLFSLSAKAKVKGVCEFLELFFDYDKKYVVFGHHMEMLNGIETYLKDKKQGYMRIDGSTSAKVRDSNVRAFQNKDNNIKFAVLSITACAEGLTLTASSTVIFAEMYWTPAKMMQAEDRVHRISQEENVDIYYLMGKDTLDDFIFQKIRSKFDLTSEILDGDNRGTYDYKVSKGQIGKDSDSTSMRDYIEITSKEKKNNVENHNEAFFGDLTIADLDSLVEEIEEYEAKQESKTKINMDVIKESDMEDNDLKFKSSGTQNFIRKTSKSIVTLANKKKSKQANGNSKIYDYLKRNSPSNSSLLIKKSIKRSPKS